MKRVALQAVNSMYGVIRLTESLKAPIPASSSTLVPMPSSQTWGRLVLYDLTIQLDYHALQIVIWRDVDHTGNADPPYGGRRSCG